MNMLAYVHYFLITYILTDIDTQPSHDLYDLLTSEHLETFHAAFDKSRPTPGAQGETAHTPRDEIKETEDQVETEHIEHVEDEITPITKESTLSPSKVESRISSCLDSPRSDEGYGSFIESEGVVETDETKDEIAALGIIEETEEVPDYGVAILPASYTSLSPLRQRHRRRSSSIKEDLSSGASPTKQKLADLATPKVQRTVSSRMSQDARNVLSMGYTLALLGEKFDKPMSVEGSVKSVIVRASQAIERGSQAGSQYGKSRYAGSRYGGSRYGGSKFGGSKISVAKSIKLDETLPSWGF